MLKIIIRTEAKERGLTRYYTGIPCKYGHDCERLTSGCACVKCHRIKIGNREKYHPEKHAARQRKNRIALKIEIMSYYCGGIPKCSCCDERILDFLTIDHVNNDGSSHRIETNINGGYKLYAWLRKNNYPSGFRVLCFNCNAGRHINGGICPHESPIL